MSHNGPKSARSDQPRGIGLPVKGFLARRPHFVPALVAVVMLLAALGKWPYDYYKIMRWVVCAAAVLTAFQGYVLKRLWAAWVFGFAAILFNPIASFHFNRDTWQALDLVAALLFLVGGVLVRRPVKNDAHTQEERD